MQEGLAGDLSKGVGLERNAGESDNDRCSRVGSVERARVCLQGESKAGRGREGDLCFEIYEANGWLR